MEGWLLPAVCAFLSSLRAQTSQPTWRFLVLQEARGLPRACLWLSLGRWNTCLGLDSSCAGLLGQAPSVLGSGSHRTPLAAGIGLPDPFWLVPGATEWTPLLLALQMGT